MDSLECFPMGSSALLLAWEPPLEINGILTGYRIYYQEVTGESELGILKQREPRIMKDKLKAKLAGLDPHSKYRVTIKVGCILFSNFCKYHIWPNISNCSFEI